MEIITYQPDHLPELTNLYNALTRSVPHCYPIEAEELAGAFAGECGYESFGEHLARETATDNYRALLFYANCGYHAVDWTRQFYRELPK